MVRAMKTPPLTPLGYALLGLAHQEPRSGYDLRRLFATTPMGYFSSSPGAIYPALARLERGGLLASRVDTAQPLRPRRLYAITAKGEAALRAWATAPVTRGDVVRREGELDLRFAFLGGLAGPAESRRFLRSLATEIDAEVRSLTRHLVAMRTEASLHGRLALESGIEIYKARARWARRALEHFEPKAPRVKGPQQRRRP
jgi:DNA-binding PadR family transcriptional regulator